MKKRHIVLIIALFIFIGFLIYLLNIKSHQEELAVNQNQLLEEEKPLVWLGPGFYYGEFFTLESEYEDWQKANIPHANDKEETPLKNKD